MPYASIFPLVTARAVARAFTYEVEEGVGPGAIVSMPFGRRRARGVVVSLESGAPDGVSPVAVEKVVGQVPPALVDLALWVADYYGSTPARALALVAPESPRRRKEQAPPAERQSLQGEAAPAELFPEQRAAIDRIVEALDAGGGTSLLLFGPTGSGKTEVYLQACAAILERGLGAIVLVPEISLTPQTVGRVRARFGERVAILHSGLTEAERRDERERIASGEARVVVGARSAVFAPVRGLGLIVVDEEHDSSYKQDSDPRYDARTVAAKRASLEGAVAVFGSATPRPESWAVLERLELGGRVGGALPPVQVVDLRREAGYPLSAPLLAELRRVAEAGGKAILLLNRRGIAPALHCRACGRTIRCPNCDVSLVLHHDGVLHCHHCGHAERDPDTCPSCGSAEVARLGAGTQWLERELGRELPDLEPIRLDADTAESAELTAAALRRFAETPRAVLLGTQMVAKGHHFAGVELAAVIDADWALGMPDFRAEERTFQLLTQLAGRSGREAPGRVVIQTFQPDARPIVHAARHDVRGFLAEELDRRNALGYPPAGHLVRIVVSGSDPAPVERALTELRDGMPGVELLGPAPLLRLRRRHRAQLIAKTDRPRAVATRAAALLAAAAPAMRRAGPHRRRRRRPAIPLAASEQAMAPALSGRFSGRIGIVKRPRAEEILGEWGVRDVTPPSAREREKLAQDRDLNPYVGAPLPRRIRRFRPEADAYVASLGGPLPYMRRLREIDDAIEAHLARLGEAYAENGGDAETWRRLAARWDFSEVNDLIERHNRWYPVEARLAMDPEVARLREGRRARLPARAS